MCTFVLSLESTISLSQYTYFNIKFGITEISLNIYLIIILSIKIKYNIRKFK